MTAWLRGELAAAASLLLVFGIPFFICAFLWCVAELESRRPEETVDNRPVQIDTHR